MDCGRPVTARAYRQLLPVFLILGDCLNALVWTIVGLATGTGCAPLPEYARA